VSLLYSVSVELDESTGEVFAYVHHPASFDGSDASLFEDGLSYSLCVQNWWNCADASGSFTRVSLVNPPCAFCRRGEFRYCITAACAGGVK